MTRPCRRTARAAPRERSWSLLPVGALSLLTQACTPVAPRLVVLYNGAQPRLAGAPTCATCLSFDLNEASPAPRVPAALLRGHSVPGVHVLDTPPAEVIVRIRETGASTVILDTCFGAEVSWLLALLSVPTVTEVVTAPRALAWGEVSLDPDCVDAGAEVRSCLRTPADLHAYSRAEVLDLAARAQAHLDAWAHCTDRPEYVSRYPYYARIEGTPAAVVFLSAATRSSWTCARAHPGFH